jgi:hypothetical protein
MDNDSKTIYFSGTPTQAGTYKYTMTATNGDSIATRSGSINVTSQGTGISENSAANNGVKVYPNPFSTDATIAINADVEANGLLTLTDMMGQTIRREEISLHDGTNIITLHNDNIEDGIYILSIKMNNLYNTIKIVIKR